MKLHIEKLIDDVFFPIFMIIVLLVVWLAPAPAAENLLLERIHTPQEILKIKTQFRKQIKDEASILSAPEENDLATHLVDHLEITSLKEMEKKNLWSASLPTQPWSDSYWPTYKGLIAHRYADPQFPDSIDWKKNFEYGTENLGKFELPDHLSPAEKYDRLVGDSHFTLTTKSLNAGKSYYDEKGSVETWMGICHGWAPASYMLERPKHSVKVIAPDRATEITFYPSDIKALATLLWANGYNRSTRFIGGRCDLKNPPTDSNGRPKREECLDTNPGTWHLAVVNQIGVNHRSMIIDATYDYQVWNQPIASYRYTYFNPKTLEASDSLEKAHVAIRDFPDDPRSKFRANGTAKIVGIQMTLTYVNEREPSTKPTDSPSDDSLVSVQYRYELELDSENNILGGEWISKNHPDFLWTPVPTARAMSWGDIELNYGGDISQWDADEVLPEPWQKAAQKSSRSEQPLARVVEKLLWLSQ